jgi:hypothetical protein
MKDNQPILAHKLLDRSTDRIAANAILRGQLKLARPLRVCCQGRELLRLRPDGRPRCTTVKTSPPPWASKFATRRGRHGILASRRRIHVVTYVTESKSDLVMCRHVSSCAAPIDRHLSQYAVMCRHVSS